MPLPPPRPASPKYDERTFFFHGSGTQPLGSAATPPAAAQAPTPAAGDPTPPPAPAPAYRHAHELVRHTRRVGAAPSAAAAPAAAAGPGASAPAREGAGGSAVAPPPLPQPHSGPSGGSAPSPLTAAVGIQSAISPAADSGRRSRATPSSQAGVRFKRRVTGKGEQLTTLAVEVAADCRGALLPDPRYDAVRAIVLAVMLDDEEVEGEAYSARVLMFDGPPAAPGAAAAEAGAPEPVAPTPCLAVRAPASLFFYAAPPPSASRCRSLAPPLSLFPEAG